MLQFFQKVSSNLVGFLEKFLEKKIAEGQFPGDRSQIGPVFLVGRTVTVIFVGIVEAVFGAEEQAAYGEYDC